ncbi:MAG: hypothetical protein WC284_12010 [Candidimonas sp.]
MIRKNITYKNFSANSTITDVREICKIAKTKYYGRGFIGTLCRVDEISPKMINQVILYSSLFGFSDDESMVHDEGEDLTSMDLEDLEVYLIMKEHFHIKFNKSKNEAIVIVDTISRIIIGSISRRTANTILSSPFSKSPLFFHINTTNRKLTRMP